MHRQQKCRARVELANCRCICVLCDDIVRKNDIYSSCVVYLLDFIRRIFLILLLMSQFYNNSHLFFSDALNIVSLFIFHNTKTYFIYVLYIHFICSWFSFLYLRSIRGRVYVFGYNNKEKCFVMCGFVRRATYIIIISDDGGRMPAQHTHHIVAIVASFVVVDVYLKSKISSTIKRYKNVCVFAAACMRARGVMRSIRAWWP